MCPDCYDYTGHVLFNAYAPELWRRFTIYLPRQLARLTGITQKALRTQVTGPVRQSRRIPGPRHHPLPRHHPPRRSQATTTSHHPARYTAALLTQAIRQAAAAVSCDTAASCEAHPPRAGRHERHCCYRPGLRRILRFGTQIDTRTIRPAGGLPGTGSALSAQAVANYIAKYATKTISAPGLPDRPVRSPAAIAALRCGQHYKRLISTCWELGKHPAAAALGAQPVDPHARLPGPLPHQIPPLLRHLHPAAPGPHRPTARPERHPDGEKDPWGRDLDEHTVLLMASLALRRNRPRHHRRTPARARRRRTSPRARPDRTRGDLDELTNRKETNGMDKLLYRPREAATVLGISKTVSVWADSLQPNPLDQGRQVPVHHRRCPAASTYEHSNSEYEEAS